MAEILMTVLWGMGLAVALLITAIDETRKEV